MSQSAPETTTDNKIITSETQRNEITGDFVLTTPWRTMTSNLCFQEL
jgi:hypothetical protein